MSDTSIEITSPATGLHVDIVTPQASVYSGPASEIQVPGWQGEFDVLPGHDLFLALVRGGIVEMETPDGSHRYVVGRGFAEASQEKVTILTDSCEPAEGIDKAQAQADLDEAETALAETAFGSPEREQAEEQYEIAKARAGA